MNIVSWLETLNSFGFQAMRALLSLLWQSSILLAAAGLLAFVLRRKRASVRHAVWIIALLAAPALPLLGWLGSSINAPQREIPVMPSYSAPAVVSPVPPVEFYEPSGESTPPPPLPFDVEQESRISLTAYPWALAFLIYATGLSLFLSLVIAGRFRIGRWIRKGVVVRDTRVLSAFEAARKHFGLKRRFLLVESERVQAPMTIRTFRPAVLLPTGLTRNLSDAELRAVAIHEMAHIKRNDGLLLTLASFVRAVLFFHPLIWLACRQISLLAEQVADDAVLEATGEALPYAQMLARLAEGLTRRSLSTELAAGIVLSKSAFLRRVEAILSDRRDQIRKLSRLALVSTILATLISLALATALPLGEKSHKDSLVKSKAEQAEGEAATSSATEAEPTGPRGYAFFFDGVDDFLEVPDSASLNFADEFTIEMWIKPAAFGQTDKMALLSKEAPFPKPEGFGLYLEKSPYTGKDPQAYAVLTFFTADGKDREGTGLGIVKRYLTEDGWFHYAAVYTQNEVDHFVNGKEAGMGQHAAAYTPARGKPLFIGRSLFGIGSVPVEQHFTGAIDEVCLWNRARTQAEILRDMKRSLTGNEPGLVACWTFNERPGQVAQDISPYHNVARLGTSPYPDDADPKWLPFFVSKEKAPGEKAKRPVGDEDEQVKKAVVVKDARHPSGWKATLPNGVTVELLGVSYNPSEGKPWWRPDGSPLAEAPSNAFKDRLLPDERSRAYEFVTRVTGVPEKEPAPTWQVIPGPSTLASSRPYEEGKSLNFTHWAAVFPKEQESFALRVRMPTGPWVTRAIMRGRSPGSTAVRGIDGGAIVLSQPNEVDGQLAVTVSDNIVFKDFRVLLLDADGGIHKPKSHSGSAGGGSGFGGSALGGVRQTTFYFDKLPLQKVKEFRFQTRPYQWVEFRNISLRPRAATRNNESAWGEVVEGVRVRLRPYKTVWKAGEMAFFEVDIRNYSLRHMTVAPTQETCEVEFDGHWYKWSGVRRYAPKALPRGGKVKGIVVSLLDLWHRKNDDEPLVLTPGTHTIRVACQPEYQKSALERQVVRVVSNPVQIQILTGKARVAADEWGPPVEGVRCRLRAEKPVWNAGEVPMVLADARNDSERGFRLTPAQEVHELEFDGSWYKWGESIRLKIRVAPFSPGRQVNGIRFSLDKRWASKKDDERLQLAPGKHRVRVALVAKPVDSGKGKPVRVISNPVEITIERALPGSRLSIQEALKDDFAFAAACEALEDFMGDWERPENVLNEAQNFKIVEVLAGEAPATDEIRLDYRYIEVANVQERGLRKGERVIWIVHHQAAKGSIPRWRGVKALPDTSENRMAVIEAVKNEPPWGEAVNGLKCRIFVAEHDPFRTRPVDALTFQVRNVSSHAITVPTFHHAITLHHAITVPTLHGQLPYITIRIKGYPELMSPTSFSEAPWRPSILQPGQTLRWNLGGSTFANYLIAFGRHERKRGWIQFDPAGKKYELDAIMKWDKDEITVPDPAGGLGARKKVKCWTGCLVSNSIRLVLPARDKPTIHWPPTAWGGVVDGLQAGLVFELGKRPYRVGETVSFLFKVRNVSDKTIKLAHTGLLGWAPTVVDAQGKKVNVWVPLINRPVQIVTRSLAPGEVINLGTPMFTIRRPGWTGGRNEATLYAAPGKYKVSQTYRFDRHEPGYWSGELTTGELELEIVPAEPGWGEAVEGVQVRLFRHQVRWKAGEIPTFEADMNNRGRRRLLVFRGQEYCELEFDGRWYRWTDKKEVHGKTSRLVSGAHIDGIPFSLGKSWQGKDDKAPLKLTVGKHTVRVAFICQPADGGKPLRAESNLVQIEIRLEEPAPPVKEDPERFQEEISLAESAADGDAKVEHLRKALLYRPNHPDNITIEFEIALLIKNSVNNSRLERPNMAEARAVLEGIVKRYDHMDYYTKRGPGSPWSAEVLVPFSALVAANIHRERAESRRLYQKVMLCLKKTHEKRKRDWETEAAPKFDPDSPFSGGELGRAKWESRMALWRKRKENVQAGRVLTRVELKFVEGAIRGYVERAKPQEAAAALREIINDFPTQEAAAALRQIIRNFPSSPLARLAAEHVEKEPEPGD